jgi:hypothetical protein
MLSAFLLLAHMETLGQLLAHLGLFTAIAFLSHQFSVSIHQHTVIGNIKAISFRRIPG